MRPSSYLGRTGIETFAIETERKRLLCTTTSGSGKREEGPGVHTSALKTTMETKQKHTTVYRQKYKFHTDNITPPGSCHLATLVRHPDNFGGDNFGRT